MTNVNIDKIIRTDKQFLVSKVVVVVIATLAILTIGLAATTVQAAAFRNGVDGIDGLPFCDLHNTGAGCYDRFDNHDEFCSKHPNDDTCGGGK
jgi:hypothetical protein